MSEWKSRIVSNKQVVGGRPSFRGARISVEFILSLMGSGWSDEAIRKEYPKLEQEDLNAAKQCAYHLMHHWVNAGRHERFFETHENNDCSPSLEEISTDAEEVAPDKEFDLFEASEVAEETRIVNGTGTDFRLVDRIPDGDGVHVPPSVASGDKGDTE